MSGGAGGGGGGDEGIKSSLIALLEQPKYVEAMQRGLVSDVYVKAAESCLKLAKDAFRCSDLQGFRHPLCLERKMRHTRCMAPTVAPEFLERLELCETRADVSGVRDESCILYENDLAKVVSARMVEHVDSVVFTEEERLATYRCGRPNGSRNGGEYRARVACLIPYVCGAQLQAWEKCLATAGKGNDLCDRRAFEMLECVGEKMGRSYFKNV